jgi:excisionase family DNA binding protein
VSRKIREETVMMNKLLTLKTAAAQLSVSVEFLKRLQRTGRLRVVRLGRAVRVSEQELDRLCREEAAK